MADVDLRAFSYDGAGPAPTALRTALHGLVVTDWISAAIARGFGWRTDVGGGTTPVVGGGAGTVFDAEQPELAIDIPTGIIFVPLSASIVIESSIDLSDGNVSEGEISLDRTRILGVEGATGTRETPINMRSDIVGGCPCPAKSALTGDLSATPTISQVLAHTHSEKEVVDATEELYAQQRLDYHPDDPPLIVGPACFLLWWAGTAATSGYAQANFLAIPSSLATKLI